MLPLLVAALAASTGVHVEETSDVSLGAARELAEAFAQALERRVGEPVRLDDPDWPGCDAGDARCLSTIRARTDARDVVLLRLFAGPTTIRLVALLFEPGSAEAARQVTVDLPREPSGWGAPLEGAARALHPEAHTAPGAADPALLPAPRPDPEVSSGAARWGPWLVFGASVAAASAGTAFALGSASARTEIETGYHASPELDALTGRVHDQAIAADVLFGVAVVGVVVGVSWLLAR